jgi:AcrR family transcriptional regulator
MGVQERREREKKELRQEILDAARDLFVREGFENVSMRKIAEKIEYSPTTIYLYFKDKADLLDCIVEETFARLVRKGVQLDQSGLDPLERLERGLRSYIEFGLKHPNHYRVTFMMQHELANPEQCVRARAMGEQAFANLLGAVERCAQHGLIETSDATCTAQILWATIHGLTSLLITKPQFAWAERTKLIDTLLENALHGLRAGSAVPA